MKRFALVALVAALLFSVVTSASATELKVKGNLDVYGIWSSNLVDHNSDIADGDNYMTTQRWRTYFTFQANENLKAILGIEINDVWGQGGGAWGTDATNTMRVKHAYLDFVFPDTAINVKAGLQGVALPSVFGHPVFDDDAAALVVSAPISDMFGLTVGYTRGVDANDNYDLNLVGGIPADIANKDDIDMAFLAAPITLDGFSATPYFGYAWIGQNVDVYTGTDDSTVWILGANAALTMFDPLTFAADLIYGVGKNDDYETKGWYAALAGSYKMDMLTATLFTTYATGLDEENGEDNLLPTLAEGWALTPYLGGARAFATGLSDGFASNSLGVGNDGTGLWTIGVSLDDITFVDNLTHKLVIAYAKGTGDDGTSAFTEEDSGWEVYFVNKYMIYENLAAINELGYFKGSSEVLENANYDLDASYFATIGFQYKF